MNELSENVLFSKIVKKALETKSSIQRLNVGETIKFKNWSTRNNNIPQIVDTKRVENYSEWKETRNKY